MQPGITKTSGTGYRFKCNYKSEKLIEDMAKELMSEIDDNTIIVNVGTDRAIGDALAPIIGSLLVKSKIDIPVYGTLDSPIHALNIFERLGEIKKKHPISKVIAIDACLGSKTSIGNIQIRNGNIEPGKGVGKNLPKVGDISIVGIVDKVDENNRFSFNNTRLNFVMEMAEGIALSILKANEMRKVESKCLENM